MKEATVVSLPERAEVEAKSPLEQVIAEGARKMLQAAIENEVQEYLQAYGGRRTDNGQAVVVRNGHLPERDLVTGVGPLESPSAAGTAPRRSEVFQRHFAQVPAASTKHRCFD
jgi:hypothetical protein